MFGSGWAGVNMSANTGDPHLAVDRNKAVAEMRSCGFSAVLQDRYFQYDLGNYICQKILNQAPSLRDRANTK